MFQAKPGCRSFRLSFKTNVDKSRWSKDLGELVLPLHCHCHNRRRLLSAVSLLGRQSPARINNVPGG